MSNQEIYDEGYSAGTRGDDQFICPLAYPQSEYWHNGYVDGVEDLA